MLDDVEVISLRPRLPFRQSHAAELGIGEDRRRQDGVIRAALSVEHVVDRDPRLILRGRREHRPDCDIAGRPDPADTRPLMLVDDDSARRCLDADPVEPERLDVGNAP